MREPDVPYLYCQLYIGGVIHVSEKDTSIATAFSGSSIQYAMCIQERSLEISMLDQYFAGHAKKEYIASLSQVIQALRANVLPNVSE